MAEFESETEAKYSLLYVGALYDAYPLTINDLRKKHDCIIFSDFLPRSQYYKKLQTETQILDILVAEGGMHGITSGFTLNTSDGSYEADLKDGCKLKYFFNVNNIDASRIPVNTIGSIWLHGHMPPSEDIRQLTNLRKVYYASACEAEEHWREFSQSDQFKEVEKIKIPDVIMWNEANGFELMGVDGMEANLLVSDSPTSFQVADVDDEDDNAHQDDDYPIEDRRRRIEELERQVQEQEEKEEQERLRLETLENYPIEDRRRRIEELERLQEQEQEEQERRRIEALEKMIQDMDARWEEEVENI